MWSSFQNVVWILLLGLHQHGSSVFLLAVQIAQSLLKAAYGTFFVFVFVLDL